MSGPQVDALVRQKKRHGGWRQIDSCPAINHVMSCVTNRGLLTTAEHIYTCVTANGNFRNGRIGPPPPLALFDPRGVIRASETTRRHVHWFHKVWRLRPHCVNGL